MALTLPKRLKLTVAGNARRLSTMRGVPDVTPVTLTAAAKRRNLTAGAGDLRRRGIVASDTKNPPQGRAGPGEPGNISQLGGSDTPRKFDTAQPLSGERYRLA